MKKGKGVPKSWRIPQSKKSLSRGRASYSDTGNRKLRGLRGDHGKDRGAKTVEGFGYVVELARYTVKEILVELPVTLHEVDFARFEASDPAIPLLRLRSARRFNLRMDKDT